MCNILVTVDECVVFYYPSPYENTERKRERDYFVAEGLSHFTTVGRYTPIYLQFYTTLFSVRYTFIVYTTVYVINPMKSIYFISDKCLP